ncbi:MAG TPA: nucleotide exchange factor GrpE [Chloroflexota bacterium]|nr:nucleotide exchange factor GrpE [Chloroflexota bacterium]
MEPQNGPREAEATAPGVATDEETDRRATDAERRADEEASRAEGYLDLLKRERADFTNYRRRVEQERTEQTQAATTDLMLSLLPALDDLERALANIPPTEAGTPLAEGIRLIDRSLRAALERAGLERIRVEGQRFDPRVHEALVQDEAPDRQEGEVVRELRPGYRLGDRVLRPAQVSVAR